MSQPRAKGSSAPKRLLIGTGLALLLAGSCYMGYQARRRVEVGWSPLVAQRTTPDPGSEFKSNGRFVPTDQAPGRLSQHGTEADYFYSVAALLRSEYVEPIKIDEKMAQGAVKGMIQSLTDSQSRYFDGATLLNHQAIDHGDIVDTGIDARFIFDDETLTKFRQKKQIDGLALLPDLIVVDVEPGSPADLAGMKPGDRISKVNEKFLLSGTDVRKLRKLQEDVTAKKADPATLKTLQNDLQARVKISITPSRARDVLSTKIDGKLSLGWVRDGVESFADLPPKPIHIDPLTTEGQIVRLRFMAGANDAVLAHTWHDGDVIDLRHSGEGNTTEMLKCLQAFVPQGKYGEIVSEHGRKDLKNESAPAFKIKSLVLKVDDTTRGAAAIFARALAASGVAKLDGNPSPDDTVVQFYDVDGQSAYTLTTGTFKAVTR